jgi:hypothetical protein
MLFGDDERWERLFENSSEVVRELSDISLSTDTTTFASHYQDHNNNRNLLPICPTGPYNLLKCTHLSTQKITSVDSPVPSCIFPSSH